MKTGFAKYSIVLALSTIICLIAACKSNDNGKEKLPGQGNANAPAQPAKTNEKLVTSPGVYKSKEARFFLRFSNTPGFGDVVLDYGQSGDVPIAGDWDGNGSATVGVY